MQGIALYRKYRPKKFSDVVGQDHIVKVLEGAIKLGNISHAYLFAGSRGTGKTSIARIMGKELGVSENDLYEIDAASNRGIDDIRAVRESVHTLPFDSKYKLYIVDETHMLTKEAWNAFLKTLEEPPEHVIFILATTEIEKVPETVLSRCQIFQFKKPLRTEIKDLALKVAKSEGFVLEPTAAELIALLGDGSFRDAHGMLEKVLSFSKDKKVSREDVEMVTGAPRGVLVSDFVSAAIKGEVDKALKALREAIKSGSDPKIFLTLSLEKIRHALLFKIAPDVAHDVTQGFSEDEVKELNSLSKEAGLNSELLKTLLVSYDSIGRSYDAALPIELALVNIAK